jgi:uncharacterized protein
LHINDKVILIRINKLYRDNMSDLQLYDATRGVWRISIDRAKKAKFAMAVYKGIIREIYQIEKWQKADKSGYKTRIDLPNRDIFKRKEFIGKVADEAIRIQYIGKSVNEYLLKGNRNPIYYINC